jgi:hypothetical protein
VNDKARFLEGWKDRLWYALDALKMDEIEEAKALAADVGTIVKAMAKRPLFAKEAEELAALGEKLSRVSDALDWGKVSEATALLKEARAALEEITRRVLEEEE